MRKATILAGRRLGHESPLALVPIFETIRIFAGPR
jgi:hypothetical protein